MAVRRGKADDPTTRNEILDAAAAIMVDEGYAAVTSRRVATAAGVNSALVYYYFESMDGLFVALFRRGADRSFDRLDEVLASPQPLWQFWDFVHDPSNSARTMEFIAVANHRKAIQAEIADYSRRFRKRELELLATVLEGYGLDPERWPAASIVLSLSGISRFMLIEQAFGVDVGHAETIAVIEREIRALEGERQP
ncbi:MAG TPA: TetR/AcrR family transcriptional regulator [Acidimicrobiales bacterium]|nr:TetR/AcrR family transcriptional regulator [Acidimicrobiales bacterium]